MGPTELVAVLFVLALYFLPSIIAHIRKQALGPTILVINVFLGWTVLGWVVALAMSVWPEAPSAPPGPSGSLVTELERLDQLRAAGALTEEEWEAAKRRLLGIG